MLLTRLLLLNITFLLFPAANLLAQHATVKFGSGYQSQTATDPIETNFAAPPKDCWPHTRWWWPGNAGSREEITRELEQMRSHGIRGVEQISMDPVYEKGNVEYLSDEFMELLKHTVKEAKRLGMEVSLNFGGPGWIIGGEFVPEEDRSKDLVPTYLDLTGPQVFRGELPGKLIKTKRSWEVYSPTLDGTEQLIAAIAGKLDKSGKLIEKSLINLTSKTKNKQLEWDIPEGEWRLMSFWLKKNGTGNAVDHFNKGAMDRYCNFLGNKFYTAFGDEFGKTVESLFADSFELANLASGLNWSTGLFGEFQKTYGYDLVPYLPAIWFELGEISPKIRYDVNEFLHQTGLNVFYKSFLGWCKAHQIKGRIQTYGFNSDNIESAGMTHIPEMEITAGEKDQADWFDTRIGPKKYVSSGAHLYNRKIVSAEVYTFIHWERYRETLEELKIASDGYLLAGATKFYNHGFNFLPEQEVAPSRSIPFAAYIQPQNVWWKYYPKLAEYIARSSWLLRQGDFQADIALYSPLANQWAINAINPRKWTREFDWGELGGLIVSNGYDYDLINDDVLQNHASIQDGNITVQKMAYKLLIVPNVETIPLKTLEFIEKYVRQGGQVLFLERLPERSTGLKNAAQTDEKVKELVTRLFNEPSLSEPAGKPLYGIKEAKTDATSGFSYGKGKVYKLNNVLDRQIWWDRQSSMLDPFLKILRNRIAPDFGIDFAFEGLRKNEGLTYLHRKVGERDFYFVANIQDKVSTIPVTFRVQNKVIRKWNPYTGEITGVYAFEQKKDGICVPLTLAPYESYFLEFAPGTPEIEILKTDFRDIAKASLSSVVAETRLNGQYITTLRTTNATSGASGEKTYATDVTGIPAPFSLSGNWQVALKGEKFLPWLETTDHLTSWSEDPATKNFSGTGSYILDFELPAEYLKTDQKLYLDLGKVGNIAEVTINGKEAGIVWMRGQQPEVTATLQKGKNHLEIKVTNTLINRISAMKNAAPIPASMVDKFGSKDKQTELPREFGFTPLPPSGLIRPVRLIPSKKVTIQL
ncbi:MAG TPA: glycosyl hydrolase [Prolixibacteraceae bacterium]